MLLASVRGKGCFGPWYSPASFASPKSESLSTQELSANHTVPWYVYQDHQNECRLCSECSRSPCIHCRNWNRFASCLTLICSWISSGLLKWRSSHLDQGYLHSVPDVHSNQQSWWEPAASVVSYGAGLLVWFPAALVLLMCRPSISPESGAVSGRIP